MLYTDGETAFRGLDTHIGLIHEPISLVATYVCVGCEVKSRPMPHNWANAAHPELMIACTVLDRAWAEHVRGRAAPVV
jgi:hypothetical protein